MSRIELSLKEKQRAINFWQNDPQKPLLKSKEKGVRKMIPIIINFNVYLLCPDTGYKTKNIPNKIYKHYLNNKE